METKHTTGPWKYNGWEVLTTADVEDGRCYGYACTKRFICNLNDGEYHEYRDELEQHANGHLIAAAPELYDMLASIENDDGKIPVWLWEKIQNTLKKARGE